MRHAKPDNNTKSGDMKSDDMKSDDMKSDDMESDDTRRDLATIGREELEISAHDGRPRNGALWLSLSLLGFYSVFSLGAWSQKHSSQPPIIGPITARANTTAPALIVHVAGAVRRPGVYTLPPNARVFDALAKAGGALPNGETNALNLADWAQDGTRIEVAFKTSDKNPNSKVAAISALPNHVATTETSSDVAPTTTTDVAPIVAPQATPPDETVAPISAPTPTSSTRYSTAPTPRVTIARKVAKQEKKPRAPRKAQSKTVAGLPRALTPDGKLSDNASPQYLEKHPLDLNKITREQLEALPGVGPSLAQKILDYRAQNNNFKSVDELDSVSGIGEKKLAALRPLLYVVGAQAVASPSPTAADQN